MKLSFKATHQHGFTLIELSIVLIITGLILVGAVQAFQIFNEKQKIERMNTYMADVTLTLKNFPSMIEDPAINPNKAYNRMPCPAPINGGPYGNNYSLENRDATGLCQGVRRITTPDGNVLVGKLPAGSLKIRNDYMRDIHGNYLVYAVSEAATNEATYSTVPGAVTVREKIVDLNTASSTAGEIIELPLKNNVQYLVVSMGSSGAGAYNFAGEVIEPCVIGSDEAENCVSPTLNPSDDGVFLASVRSDKTSNSFYDDHVEYAAYLPTVVSNETPPSCEQFNTVTAHLAECPEGWKEISTPSDLIRRGDNSSSEGSFLNVDPETGDTYFSGIITPNSLEMTSSTVSDSRPHIHKLILTNSLPQPVSISCEKLGSNESSTKCFTRSKNYKTAGVGMHDKVKAAKVKLEQNPTQENYDELNELVCVDGYKTDNIRPSYKAVIVGENADRTLQRFNGYNISCRKE
jgi:prepilin-type N-terminal cleavage/methylation domain-containing protein